MPEYSAPEQAIGGQPTEQTDIYALGIVLYEMLTGAVPFKSATHLSTLLCQINEAPRALRQLRADIPPPLEGVVMQMLDKKPGKRQQTMARVGKELSNCARPSGSPSGLQLPATAAWWANSPTSPRHWARWKAASGAAVGLLAGAGYFGFFWESTPVASAPVVTTAPQRVARASSGPRVAAVDRADRSALNDNIPPPPIVAKIDDKPPPARIAPAEVKPPQAKVETKLPAQTKELAALGKPVAANPVTAAPPEKRTIDEPIAESRAVTQPQPWFNPSRLRSPCPRRSRWRRHRARHRRRRQQGSMSARSSGSIT